MRPWLRARSLGALCVILAGAGAGCTEHPYLSSGDANSAAVGYGDDLAAATAVAREHCLRYGRVPRFLDAEENIAYFACEPQ
jgi:hypothetical protein